MYCSDHPNNKHLKYILDQYYLFIGRGNVKIYKTMCLPTITDELTSIGVVLEYGVFLLLPGVVIEVLPLRPGVYDEVLLLPGVYDVELPLPGVYDMELP